MNILPHKSWHVRTKKNIARVRRDEAKAAEEEKETQRRIALAAQEARTALLRERASKRLADASPSSVADSESLLDQQSEKGQGPGDPDLPGERGEPADLRFGIPLGSLKDVVQPDGHVNFFQDVEAGKRQGGVNAEHEEEKKKEQEEYEKKIGYLVYLGQGSLEESRAKPWYAKIDRDKRLEELNEEVEKVKELDQAAGTLGGLEQKSKSVSMEDVKMAKFKSFMDPLNKFRKFTSAAAAATSSLHQRFVKASTSSSTSAKRKFEGDSVESPEAKKQRTEETSFRFSRSPDKSHKKSKHKKHSKSSTKKSKKHKKSSKHKKRHRNSSKSSESSSDDSESEKSEDEDKKSKLEKLRKERLQREKDEKKRAEKVLAKLRGEPVTPQSKPSKDKDLSSPAESFSRVKQKYNSQFNPHLARQNYD